MQEHTATGLEELRERGNALSYAEDLYVFCLQHNVSADYVLELPIGLPYPDDELLAQRGQEDDEREQIANNIKKVRKKRGITVSQIEEYLGISWKIYVQYENGRYEPLSTYVLCKLCLYYDVSADYLLGLPKGLSYPDDEE